MPLLWCVNYGYADNDANDKDGGNGNNDDGEVEHGRQKRIEVEEIEWRSLHLHSINSKPTFRPPQCRERTGTNSACRMCPGSEAALSAPW